MRLFCGCPQGGQNAVCIDPRGKFAGQCANAARPGEKSGTRGIAGRAAKRAYTIASLTFSAGKAATFPNSAPWARLPAEAQTPAS
jgi:hypothetical protein